MSSEITNWNQKMFIMILTCHFKSKKASSSFWSTTKFTKKKQKEFNQREFKSDLNWKVRKSVIKTNKMF